MIILAITNYPSGNMLSFYKGKCRAKIVTFYSNAGRYKGFSTYNTKKSPSFKKKETSFGPNEK